MSWKPENLDCLFLLRSIHTSLESTVFPKVNQDIHLWQVLEKKLPHHKFLLNGAPEIMRSWRQSQLSKDEPRNKEEKANLDPYSTET